MIKKLRELRVQRIMWVVLGVFLLGFVCEAHASTIIYSQIDGTERGFGWRAGDGYEPGDDFFVTSDSTLESMTWLVEFPFVDRSTKINLYLDNGSGTPGTTAVYTHTGLTSVNGTHPFIPASSGSVSVYNMVQVSGMNYALTAGQIYWITVQGGSGPSDYITFTGATNGSGGANLSQSQNGGAWIDRGQNGQFFLGGSPASAPEPSTLFGIAGLVATTCFRRRRRAPA